MNQVNSRHEILSQKPRAEQIGHSLIDLFFSAPEWADSLYLRSYRKAMQERVPVYFEDYYAPIDLWTGVSVYPKADGGIAVFFKDIAEEKRAKRRLEAERQKLEAVFGESPAGYVNHAWPRFNFRKNQSAMGDLSGPARIFGSVLR